MDRLFDGYQRGLGSFDGTVIALMTVTVLDVVGPVHIIGGHHELRGNAMTLRVEFERDGDVAVVDVTGVIDGSTLGELRRLSNGTVSVPSNSVVVDCEAMTLIDSAGIVAILELVGQVAEHGGTVTVKHPTPTVRRVLAVTGLEDRVTVT